MGNIPEKIEIFQVPARKFGDVYPLVKDYVKKAVERISPKLTGNQFVQNVSTGKWQLWMIWVPDDRRSIGFMVTELEEYENGERNCHMVIVTGDFREKWQHLMLDKIEKWATEKEGCSYLSGWCRPGWEGITRQHGFKRTHVLIEKKLVRKEVKPSTERVDENGRWRQGRVIPDGDAEVGSVGRSETLPAGGTGAS